MSNLCYKSLDVEVKAADEDAGTVSLYAAAFNNVDRQGEVIAPGAFANLSEFTADGWLGLAHDMRSLPVATVESAVQDGVGLLLTCRWHSTPHAQDARTTVRERKERGKSVKCSIGYTVLEDARETRDGVPVVVLKRLALYEASIVNLPANPRAEVVQAKAWWQVFEDARAAIKSGEPLENRDRRRLEQLAGRLRDEADALTALAKSAPNDSEDVEPRPDLDAGRRLIGEFLYHCANYPPYRLRN